jgi:hypothetical protein
MSKQQTPVKDESAIQELGEHEDHPSHLDKHGYEVDDDIQQAIEKLRSGLQVDRAICCYYETKRLQVWSHDKYLHGSIVRAARSAGFELDFARTRTWLNEDVGYAEFVPTGDEQ